MSTDTHPRPTAHPTPARLHHPASAAGLAPHGAGVSDTGLTVLSKLLDAGVIAGALLASAHLLRSTWDVRYTLAALLAALVFFLLAEIARLFHGKWSSLEGIPLISVDDTPFRGVDGWVKRAEDLGLASVLLLLAAVPMRLIAAAVKLGSPGPVLFKPRRYGIHGQEIGVWKFRTRRVCQDGDQVPQATRQDPRLTKLGAFLRRTSLDELPQFINVLLGDMSIVGPRPHAVAHNQLYRGQIQGDRLRHKVRPGITGWAQINGWRGETDTLEKMAKRVEHDLWYIRHWSLWLDLKIVRLTAVRGFAGAGAY